LHDHEKCGFSRFRSVIEVEYALKFKKPVQLHWENGISEIFYQYPLPFMEREHTFFLAWQEFFCKTNFEI